MLSDALDLTRLEYGPWSPMTSIASGWGSRVKHAWFSGGVHYVELNNGEFYRMEGNSSWKAIEPNDRVLFNGIPYTIVGSSVVQVSP